MDDDLYWLGFSAFPGIGPSRFRKLLETFFVAKTAWEADAVALNDVLGTVLTKKFLAFRQGFSLKSYKEKLENKNISFLLLKDTNYPQLLKDMQNAPFVLYVKGDIDLVSSLSKSIAVVGTRKVTQYGREVTTLLTKQLVEQSFVIISGLALGVDAIAHEVAMDNNGKTIAVLGCGVDCCSPSFNQPIYDKIMRNFGAVVSESAFGSSASKGMFPARNRIIAGLSLGVVVTEGSEDSGALITAQRALEISRPVFAVPGPNTSALSKAPLDLIQKGAHIVQHAGDILDSLQLTVLKTESGYTHAHDTNRNIQGRITSDVPEEQQILDLLENEALHIDAIGRRDGKSSEVIGSLLSIIELKGLIKNREGKFSSNLKITIMN